jgi:hypothetical protein
LLNNQETAGTKELCLLAVGLGASGLVDHKPQGSRNTDVLYQANAGSVSGFLEFKLALASIFLTSVDFSPRHSIFLMLTHYHRRQSKSVQYKLRSIHKNGNARQ